MTYIISMKKVAIIDSGSGGINVLAMCLSACPCFNYLLYIDDKNLPYGNKSVETLREIATKIVQNLIKVFSPSIIIIGCNTLTAVAIKYLEKTFPTITFIGTYPDIEGAKKLGSYLTLATKVTIENSSVLAGDREHCFCPVDLPKIIDENLQNRENISQYLQKTLPKGNFDSIVLGCTHFEGIKKELSQIYGNPTYFDGSVKVVSRLKRYSYGSDYQVQIICSRDKFPEFYAYFSDIISVSKFL